jgi:hypothetical protein
MGLWSEPGFPHKGWESETVIDLRQDEGCDLESYDTCQACDHERIRFVHILKNSGFPASIRVGCVCAEKLTEDYTGPRAREANIRSFAARRDRFPNRKWKTSKNGNIWLNYDGLNIGAIPLHNGKFKVWIGHRFGKLVYGSLREAQLRIFDVLELGKNLKSKASGTRT